MIYIYENYTYNNIFELIDSNFPDNNITTVGVMKEDDKDSYDEEMHKFIKNLDDDMFFDTKLKRAFSNDEFYAEYNIRIANEEDIKSIYGF